MGFLFSVSEILKFVNLIINLGHRIYRTKPHFSATRQQLKIAFLFLFILLCLSNRPLKALAPESPVWRWSHPNPHGNNIFEVVEFNETLIQLCDSGKMYVSSDGEEWSFVETGTSNNLRSATTFNNALVVGTTNGEILRSEDLENFQTIQLSESDWIEGVASSRTHVIAVGDNGKIWASTDGIQWTSVPSITTNWFRGIHYDGTFFVAVGENGELMTSLNGINWVTRESGTSEHLNRVSSFNNRLVAVGENGVILSSTNGINWVTEASTVSDDLFNITMTEHGELIGGHSVALFKESDSTTWQIIEENIPEWIWLSSTYWNDYFYLCGRTGLTFQLSAGEDSDPLMDWGTFDDSVRNWIWDLEIVNDEFFAAGDLGTVMTSFRGVRWESLEVPTTVTNSFLMGLGHNDLGLVAVGTEGSVIFSAPITSESYTTNIIENQHFIITNLVVVNGRQFEDVRPSGLEADLQGITSFNGKFFASGEGGLILSSEDGINWQTIQTSQTAFLSSLANNGETIVVSGSEGTHGYSADGVDWTFLPSLTENWLIRARFINESFFVMGQNGVIFTSNDGTTWQQIPVFDSDIWIQDFFFHQDVYYAVGTKGTMWWSSDLNQWNALEVPTGKSLYSITGNSRRILAAGIEGVILRTLTSSIFDPISINEPTIVNTLDQESLGMALLGVTDQKFEIQSSPDLLNWEPIIQDEITDPDGLYLFLLDFLTEDNGTPLSSEFFRVYPLEADIQ